MSGDGAAEGTMVTLMVARAGAGPPLVTQLYPGAKWKGSPLAPCFVSLLCWGWCLACGLGHPKQGRKKSEKNSPKTDEKK